MILPHYTVTDPVLLTQAILVLAPGKEVRAAELSISACEAGKINDIDPAWLAAVALGETPSLKPTVPGGVCTVVGSGAKTITESVHAAGKIYKKIVKKHGRKNAHLYYGCGNSRCGGKWTPQGKYKILVYKRLKRKMMSEV